MALVLRTVKGAPLTNAEVDGNFTTLDGKIDSEVTDLEEKIETVAVSAGYSFIGEYGAGVEMTAYNQVIRGPDGQFWRVSGPTALPYTTTGAGLPEGGALVSVGDAALRQELAAGDGASKVGYTPAGVGAVATDVESKLRETVSVKDFGAVGDGVTDDTAAIQAAATYISVLNGKRLFFPSGTYKITDAITFGFIVGFETIGASRGSVVIKQHTANKQIFKFTNTDTHSFLIDGITFDYNTQQAYSSTSAHCIEFNGSGIQIYNFEIRNCSFDNARRGISAAGGAVVWGYLIEQCWFKSNLVGAGIAFATPVGQPNIAIRSCYWSHDSNTNESDLILTSAETVLLQNLEFNNGTYPASTHAILCTNCKAVTVIGCKVENVVWQSNALFNFPQNTAVTVTGCNFFSISGTRSGSPSFIRADTGGAVSVIGCQFQCSGTNSFPVVANTIPLLANCVYSGNIIFDWTGFGLANPKVRVDVASAPLFRSAELNRCFVTAFDTLPVSGTKGEISFQNSTGKGYMWDGSAWQALW